MKTNHLVSIVIIFLCTTAGWVILGGALDQRSQVADEGLTKDVTQNWGPPLTQSHPTFYYIAPNAARSRRVVQPESSDVTVDLKYQPRTKGLINYRTYQAAFNAVYTIKNPAPIEQVVYATFQLPSQHVRYDAFSMKVGEKVTDKAPTKAGLTESMLMKPGEAATVTINYRATGLNVWRYEFDLGQRVRNFQLAMNTDFSEINFPGDTASANGRRVQAPDGSGWKLEWKFEDVIGARAIGMDMPKVLNAGPVASRIAFFAPVSLLFYFAVLLIVALTRRLPLHPMHWFFLAAGCFAFQLLFAYLVDLVPVFWSFVIAAIVSLALVNGYLWRVAGLGFACMAGAAQFAYMVLFSYSFFFDGLTGITITIGAVLTLALLMKTAGTDWHEVFEKPAALPPPLPCR